MNGIAPVIEVFSDIWCPFAYVGLTAVRERRAALGRDDVSVATRAWPLELVNGEPLDPVATLAHVEELRRQVAPGLFTGFAPDRFPSSTLDALDLVACARRTSSSLAERTSFALREALFEHGQDISDPGVLGQVAHRLGVGAPGPTDRAAVIADWREGQQRGVEGSPHFFCRGVDLFCPTLDIARQDGGLTISRNVERLDEFLDRCFEGDQPLLRSAHRGERSSPRSLP